MSSHPSQGWDGGSEQSPYKSTACPCSELTLRAAPPCWAHPAGGLIGLKVLIHLQLDPQSPPCVLESLSYPQLSYLLCSNWSGVTSQVRALLPTIY